MKTVTRLLIYRGDDDRVDQVLEKSLGDGTWDFGHGIQISALTLPLALDVQLRIDSAPFNVARTTSGEVKEDISCRP